MGIELNGVEHASVGVTVLIRLYWEITELLSIKTATLINASNEVGADIYQEKRKYSTMLSFHQNSDENHDIK
jgi:hypothetical protein